MLRKVSKAAGAPPEAQRETPPSPILAGQTWARRKQQGRQPNREMPWVDRDYVSAAPTDSAAHASFPPRAPTVLPEFLRQGDEALGFKSQGLLSTMRYLDFSDVEVPAGQPGLTGQDDLGSLIDDTKEIDWVSCNSYCVIRTPSSILDLVLMTSFHRTWSIRIC